MTFSKILKAWESRFKERIDWFDPRVKIIGLLRCQSMMQVELPEKDFQVLGYQALIDYGFKRRDT